MMIYMLKFHETKFIGGKLSLMCDDRKPYTFVYIRIIHKMRNKSVTCQNNERKISFSLYIQLIMVKS